MDIPGVGPKNFAIDLLHTWHLGPIARYIGFVLWFIIDTNVYGSNIPWLGIDECKQLGILQMRNEMWTYYKNLRRDDPSWARNGSEVDRHGPPTNDC